MNTSPHDSIIRLLMENELEYKKQYKGGESGAFKRGVRCARLGSLDNNSRPHEVCNRIVRRDLWALVNGNHGVKLY